ncbi:UTP--glucose-1-phosphate uridylyltransferase GalU [Candidatus Micrarchaeota archaeon]|nr:UTP--glucose-1-phosphate uridylyltransferase GalU [Candidatus Micrarchaeota archaeon]MBI5176476.1 UTP--glucose-1-phosphate uridylyltransferase GalU [Candidatus Micrarchaeota archaeon]
MVSSAKIKKAVIPAAGLGTRFLPATKAQPKEMLPLVDKPVIQFVVEEAVASGIDDILIVTGRGKHAIENHFDRSLELESYLKSKGDSSRLADLEKIEELAEIHYIRQPEPLGLGHAVSLAEKHVDGEPFAVLLGDTIFESSVPCTKQLVQSYEKHHGSVIAVREVDPADVERWGIVKGTPLDSATLRVEDLVEKPAVGKAPSNLAIAARYIITPGIFGCLRETKPGKNGEIQLTDALRLLSQKEPMFAKVVDAKWYDIGTKEDYALTFFDFALKHPKVGKEFEKHAREALKP